MFASAQEVNPRHRSDSLESFFSGIGVSLFPACDETDITRVLQQECQGFEFESEALMEFLVFGKFFGLSASASKAGFFYKIKDWVVGFCQVALDNSGTQLLAIDDATHIFQVFEFFLPVEGTEKDVDQMGASLWNYLWHRAVKDKTFFCWDFFWDILDKFVIEIF